MTINNDGDWVIAGDMGANGFLASVRTPRDTPEEEPPGHRLRCPAEISTS